MDAEIIARVRAWLKEQRLVGALVSDPFNVGWLTGHFPSATGGPDPFAGGPAVVWVSMGKLVLLVAGAEAASRAEGELLRRTYIGYSVERTFDPAARLREEFQVLVNEQLPPRGNVGIEQSHLPLALYEILRTERPALNFVPIDGLLTRLRAIKTAGEIEKLQASLMLCDQAQAELRASAAVGLSEIELFGRVHAAVERAAGQSTPMVANLAAGPRTAEAGVVPSGNSLHDGDVVLFDVALQHNGYWGDNAATLGVREVSPELQRIHQVVRDALELAVNAVQPGRRANQVDTDVRAFIRQQGFEPYWHHTGHGIGVSYHESPRLVPTEETVLESGMVICLEPGIYLRGVGGVRIEDAVLVKVNGAERLTHHVKSL